MSNDKSHSAGSALPWISADEIFGSVDYLSATRAIQSALVAGLQPSEDFTRSILTVDHGQLLLMPSASSSYVGVKVATVAPANPDLGRERIQGIYLLMDAETLTPRALLDGAALTTLRTPAVSAAAADLLAPSDVDHLVVFGTGPQARGHIDAIRAIRPVARVSVVGSAPGRATAMVDELRDAGMTVREGTAGDVRDAQVVVCATTARRPLFDGSLVPDDSCTISVGSHDADAREFDSTLAVRAQLVVEDVAVALRESGEVAMPIEEGVVDAADLVPMRDIITGGVSVDRSGPRAFTSSGMSWEDLVVAGAVFALSADR